jgi:hypothetical protein
LIGIFDFNNSINSLKTTGLSDEALYVVELLIEELKKKIASIGPL